MAVPHLMLAVVMAQDPIGVAQGPLSGDPRITHNRRATQENDDSGLMACTFILLFSQDR
jgi:hypothetical protein